jgi:poly-gamma-glutamate synthesis protein (capsule biosynthesis protein)
LKSNKTQGYINIVSVHRGREYETTHNIEQESLGKQLIDCGADIIIGHHPHVIQDI